MRATRWSVMMVVALALGACGNRQSADHRGSPTTPATALAPPAAPAAPAATAIQKQEAGLAKAEPGIVAHPNEDGSETVDAGAGDSGLHNVLLTAVASTLAAGSSAASAAPANLAPPPLWQEGVNYTRMVPAQPTSVPPGQVEVLEFFWYGCPHCYALDPKVESWRKSKPAYITFSRVPVMWMEGHRSTARLYYALEDMGKIEQLHSKVFEEIHVNGDPLIAADPNDTAGAERVQAEFLNAEAERARSRVDAPVKAPRSLPNNSDSIRFSGSAAQFRRMNGFLARRLNATIARAASSFPVPLSPRINTFTLLSATC